MFSIVIPLYNKEDSVVETVSAVLEQTYNEYEVLIVDDGSSDQSLLKLECLNDKRIRIIKKENGGVSSARNRGIQEARYNYIAFLDADDVWEPDYLEEQARLIHDFPDAKMWGCAFGYLQNNQKTEIDHKLPLTYRNYIDNYFGMSKSSVLFWTSSVVVDKSVFQQIELFDERISMGEDLDMWFRIILQFKVAFYNRILSYYKLDAENKAMQKEIKLQSFLPYYIDKYNDHRKQNPAFRHFFDKFCLKVLYPLYKKNPNDKDIQYILKKISINSYSLSYRLRYKCPDLYDYILKLKHNFQ